MEPDRERADARLEEALERDGVHDPRGYFRERLKLLRQRGREAFDAALRHYDEVLLPRVLSAEADPIREWFDYGRKLADLTAPGRLTEIDESGRAHRFEPPLDPRRLVLHLPDDSREPGLILNLPRDPSPAQRATCDLLVWGRTEPAAAGDP